MLCLYTLYALKDFFLTLQYTFVCKLYLVGLHYYVYPNKEYIYVHFFVVHVHFLLYCSTRLNMFSNIVC